MDFKRSDLEKAAAFGRESPLLASAVYVAGPQTPNKMLFRTRDALVLKNFGEFKAETLKPFLDLLGGAGAEGGER